MAIALLASGPALADGGTGGFANNGTLAGGTGATGFDGQTGGTGGTDGAATAGGGGGGAGGGTGGNGGGVDGGPGGAGGPGGTALIPDGQAGADGDPTIGGPGGGGGGYNGNGPGTTTIGGSSLAGGSGGAGGSNAVTESGGGGGGAGGYGAIVTGSGTSTVTGVTIAGGVGGAGGNTNSSNEQGGSGGDGGGGVQFTASGATLIVGTGTTISGGQGGAAGTGVAGSPTAGAGGAGIVGSGLTIVNGGTISGGFNGSNSTQANAVIFTGGTNSFELDTGGSVSGNVVVSAGAGSLTLGGSGSASFDVSKIGSTAQYQGFTSYSKTGTGTWTLGNTTTAMTNWAINTGTLSISADNNLGAVGGTLTFGGGTLETTATLSSARTITLNAGGGTFQVDTGTTTTLTGGISGTGGLTKTGSGALAITSANIHYDGATTISGGTLAMSGNGALEQSSGVNLAGAGATFDVSGVSPGSATIKDLSGVSGSTVALGSKTLILGTANDTTFAGAFTGGGGIVKQGTGTLALNGTSTIGSTEVAAGKLLVNGNLTSTVTVDSGASFGGTGTITGNVTVAGTIAPGNSIGTFTVTGNYTQTGVYSVEVNSAGQSNKIAVTGTATLTGGTVSVQAANGTYQRNTAYTILTAGSISGTYAGVTSNLAFLTPSLGYSGGAVTLTLLSTANSFRNGAQTSSQGAVATVLDNASSTATGDFNTVLNALYGLDTTQGPKALDAIGGQNYSGFSSLAIQGSQLFMDSFSLHAGGGAGGGGASLPGGSTYMALKADDCDTACDVEPLWGAWGGGLGAFGTVAGDSNSHGLTYTLGGFIAGLDRKFEPGFRAGVAAGFNAATLYTQGMPGTGTSNTLQFALYGEYRQEAFYLDALAGYGHSDNRMNRPIVIPGLPFRVAQGYITANTFFGQLEAGYKIPVAPSFGGFVTPFARLQASTSTQGGFSETGADSLNLTIAQQTTQSLRTVLGAQLGANIDAPWHEKLDLVFRLGWSHEFADQTRPVTAAFAGAPALSFTTFGAQAPRDGVVLGLGANTQVAEHTSVYLRYDGDLAGANTNHVLNAGVRYVW